MFELLNDLSLLFVVLQELLAQLLKLHLILDLITLYRAIMKPLEHPLMVETARLSGVPPIISLSLNGLGRGDKPMAPLLAGSYRAQLVDLFFHLCEFLLEGRVRRLEEPLLVVKRAFDRRNAQRGRLVFIFVFFVINYLWHGLGGWLVTKLLLVLVGVGHQLG